MSTQWPLTWEQVFRKMEQFGVDIRQLGQEDVMRDYLRHLEQEIKFTKEFLGDSPESDL